jgi:hypothetical protein
MPLIRSYAPIYTIFLIYFIMLSANCQNANHFSDNFNSGIDPAIWRIEGRWTPDNVDSIDGSHSIRSDVRCLESATISLVKPFVGPCRISFFWKISGRHNNLTLYDNNLSTLYKLPDYLYGSAGHESVNWTEVTFNLSDHTEHNFKWVHENPYDIGSARLDNVQIDYSIPPRFEDFAVTPEKAICLSDSVSDVVSDSIISSKFNYSVKSSSNNLTLMILPPNSSVTLGPFYPNLKNHASQGMNKFEWNDIQLDCRDIGDYTYWFINDEGYLSPRKIAPHVTTLVDEVSAEIYSINNINKTYRTRYGISIKSLKNWKISMIVPDGRQLDGTETYSAGTGLQNFVWDHKWNASEQRPTLKFYLN